MQMKKCLPYIIILLLICNVAVANDAVDPSWIGIVTIEGILVPIGTYNKDKWINTWPEISIDEQPEVDKLARATNDKMPLKYIPDLWKGPIKAIPTKLYLWSNEPIPKQLNVIDAEKYYSHCSVGWALKTDLQPTKKVDYSPTPKIGVATNHKSNVIPFERLSKKNKLPLSLIKAIKAKFNGRTPIKLTNIYKARNKVKEGDIYFIEAQQKYPYSDNTQSADCYNLNSLNCWVLLQGNKIKFLSSEFIATDCDGKETHDVVPNVVISVQGRYYVVSENYGYEWESYTIHQLIDDSMKEVLNVDGGGC
jgi:hypothetical protein